MDTTSARTTALGLAERADLPAQGIRRAGARPVPQRSAAFAHLTLEDLREYRKTLATEEAKVSYWRRIIQARLDMLRAGTLGPSDGAHLRPVLTDARVAGSRSALVEVLPIDDIPPLPRLAELWERRVEDGDVAGFAALDADLFAAEQQLSAYRKALHKRIGDATGELIARYREAPELCLSVLPLRQERRASA